MLMHDRRVADLRHAICLIGVDIRSQAMGIGWDDVDATVMALGEFVRGQNLAYGIAHNFRPAGTFLDRLHSLVEDFG